MEKNNLLKILACPKCLADLKPAGHLLVCQKCRAKFPIVAGKPLFLAKISEVDQPSGRHWRGIDRAANFYFPSRREENLAKLKERYSKGETVLNLGGGCKKYGFKQEINLDIAAFPQVDVIADAQQLPFRDESFDLVIADALLEHVPDPQGVVAEIRRVLKKGGLVYANTPFLQRYHGYPQDYHRWTVNGVGELFKQFKTVKAGVSAGPWVSFVEFNLQLVRLVSRNQKFIFYPLLGLLLPILAILRPLFLLVPPSKENILANAFYYLGKK